MGYTLSSLYLRTTQVCTSSYLYYYILYLYIGHLGLIGPLGLNFTLLLYFTGKVTDQKSQYLEESKDALLGVTRVITSVTSNYSVWASK